MTSYLGIDVVDINFNRTGAIRESVNRKYDLLDSETGKRFSDEHAPAPAPIRPFTWTAFGRQEIAALRSFIDARHGKAIPFWLPSYQWDLTLAEDLASGSAIATVQWVRYAQQMFGLTGARRHVALWQLGIGTYQFHQVTAATDPGNGLTETLQLSPAAGGDQAAATTVISFLKYCRLDNDLTRVRYLGGMAEAVISVHELPLEAPM